MTAGTGAQLYKSTSHNTFAAVTNVAARVTGQKLHIINGVYTSFDPTFGEGGTFHNGKFIVRASSPNMFPILNKPSVTNGTVWVTHGGAGNVLTITEADSPTAIFEV